LLVVVVEVVVVVVLLVVLLVPLLLLLLRRHLMSVCSRGDKHDRPLFSLTPPPQASALPCTAQC
jgi:hypothetical protein